MACVALGRASRNIVTGSTDWIVRIHDARTAQPRHVLRLHTAAVHAVACSPTHDVCVSGGDDVALFVERLSDGRRLRTLQARGSRIWDAQFTADGRHVWTVAQDGVARAYRLRDGRIVAHRRITSSPLISLALHGPHLAAGAGDGRVWLLDTRSPDDGRALEGHQQTVYGLAFDPSGRWLASGSADWSGRVWDMATHECVQVLEGFDDAVFSLAFTPDGERLAVACGGGAIHVLQRTAP